MKIILKNERIRYCGSSWFTEKWVLGDYRLNSNSEKRKSARVQRSEGMSEWFFPSRGYGETEGFSNSGLEMFKG